MLPQQIGQTADLTKTDVRRVGDLCEFRQRENMRRLRPLLLRVIPPDLWPRRAGRILPIRRARKKSHNYDTFFPFPRTP
jgi:hypothetical protein